MGLANSLNNGILDTVLSFLGVTGITATTDTPAAKLTIQFTQWGKPKTIDLTIQEIVNSLTQGPNQGRTAAPAGDHTQ